MIYIIEGGDATGKSSLSKAIGALSNTPVMHFGRPEELPMVSYLAPLMADNIILDRSWVGSRVWSELGYHEPTVTQAEWEELCSLHARKVSQLLILVREPPAIRETIFERGETMRDYMDAVLAQDLFINLAVQREVLYIPVNVVSPQAAKLLYDKNYWRVNN